MKEQAHEEQVQAIKHKNDQLIQKKRELNQKALQERERMKQNASLLLSKSVPLL